MTIPASPRLVCERFDRPPWSGWHTVIPFFYVVGTVGALAGGPEAAGLRLETVLPGPMVAAA